MTLKNQIPLSAPAGWELFQQAIGQRSCLQLFEHFVTQDNLTYCGPATASMILNASGISRPESIAHGPHRLFFQESMFTAEVPGDIARDAVLKEGVSLEEFSQWLNHPELRSTMVHADESTPDEFRDVLFSVMSSESDRFIAVNYNRQALGQQGGGHISPLGLFHPDSDMALILDVSRYKYQPHWAGVDALFRAMSTDDIHSGFSRGWLDVGRISPRQVSGNP